MYFNATILGTVILACVFTLTQGSDKCYYAKTCVHDGKEKCGINEKGNVRRFIDSCDIKEYNCLKVTDFKKTSLKDCQSLPPLKEQGKSLAHQDTEETVGTSKETATKPIEAVNQSNEAVNESKEAVNESKEAVNESKETVNESKEPLTEAVAEKSSDTANVEH